MGEAIIRLMHNTYIIYMIDGDQSAHRLYNINTHFKNGNVLITFVIPEISVIVTH